MRHILVTLGIYVGTIVLSAGVFYVVCREKKEDLSRVDTQQ